MQVGKKTFDTFEHIYLFYLNLFNLEACYILPMELIEETILRF